MSHREAASANGADIDNKASWNKIVISFSRVTEKGEYLPQQVHNRQDWVILEENVQQDIYHKSRKKISRA